MVKIIDNYDLREIEAELKHTLLKHHPDANPDTYPLDRLDELLDLGDDDET